MRNNGLSRAFLDAIAAESVADVFRYPGILKKVVPVGATNGDALSAMMTNNLNAIAVVDENRRLRGVVEREQIVSKLVLSLAGAPEVAGTR